LTAQKQTTEAAGPAVTASTIPAAATLSIPAATRPIPAPRVSKAPQATAGATLATATPPVVPIVPDWSIPSVRKGFLARILSLDDTAANKVKDELVIYISSKVITKKIEAEYLHCLSEEAKNEIIVGLVSEDLQIDIGQNNHSII